MSRVSNGEKSLAYYKETRLISSPSLLVFVSKMTFWILLTVEKSERVFLKDQGLIRFLGTFVTTLFGGILLKLSKKKFVYKIRILWFQYYNFKIKTNQIEL